MIFNLNRIIIIIASWRTIYCYQWFCIFLRQVFKWNNRYICKVRNFNNIMFYRFSVFSCYKSEYVIFSYCRKCYNPSNNYRIIFTNIQGICVHCHILIYSVLDGCFCFWLWKIIYSQYTWLIINYSTCILRIAVLDHKIQLSRSFFFISIYRTVNSYLKCSALYSVYYNHSFSKIFVGWNFRIMWCIKCHNSAITFQISLSYIF